MLAAPPLAMIGHPEWLRTHLAGALAASTSPLAPRTILIGGILQRTTLARALAREGTALNVALLTLGEFGLELGRANPTTARRLDPASEYQLAHDAAVAAAGYLEKVAGAPGVTDAVRRLVRELAQEGIGPEEFATAITASGVAESREKAATLAEVYRRYCTLTAGYYTGATRLAEADPADFAGSALYVYGIRQLAEAPRRLIKGIADRGVPVTFFLPTLSPQADLAHADLLEWLVDECGAEVTRLDDLPAAATTLGHLKAHLFDAGSAATPDAEGTVQVVSAPSREAEAREAVRACLRWADQGVLFRDMAVVMKDIRGYQGLVEEALREAGIAYYSGSGMPLPHTPVGRQLMRLLGLAGADVPRRPLMDFVAEQCIPSATLEPYGKVTAYKWDRYSRKAGVVGGLDQWRTNLGASIDADEAAVKAGTAFTWVPGTIGERRVLLRFVEDFQAEVLALRADRTLAEHVQALLAFVDRWVVEGRAYLGRLEDLERISDIVGRDVPFEEFLAQVTAMVESAVARDVAGAAPGRFARRGVNLLDASQMPHLSFRAVCVVGLNEGVFPSSPGQDPLLLDDERRRLNEATGWTLPLRAGGHDPQPMQFGLMVHGAEEFLQISYARAVRPGGRETLPSAYLCQALSALTGRRVAADDVADLRDDPVLTWVSSGRVGPANADLALGVPEWDRALLQDRPAVGRALLGRETERAALGLALSEARALPGVLTPFDGVLADPGAIRVAAAHFRDKRTSATTIARYAKCPRQFMLSSVLGLREVDDPDEILEMQVSTRGTVIHNVLEEFLETTPPADLTMANQPDLAVRIVELVEKHFEVQVRKGMAGRPGLHGRTCTDIAAECISWLEHMLATGEFDPGDRYFLEVEFPSGAVPELVVATASGDVRFRGFIDRLGQHPDGSFSVLDYKTGRVLDLEDGEIGDGTDLQLPLYMLAGAQVLGLPLSKGSAAYEFVSRRNGYRRITLTGPELQAQWGRFQQVMDEIAGGVATGDFHAQPSSDSCRYCDFKLLCGTDREKVARRKDADPHVAHFMHVLRGDTEWEPS